MFRLNGRLFHSGNLMKLAEEEVKKFFEIY